MFDFEPVTGMETFQMAGYHLWCPCVVYSPEDGLFHMFASRWSAALPFHPAWLTNSEVVRAVSRNPEGPYEFAEVVFPARGAEYWDGCSMHNPRVLKYGDRYLLFYTGISYPFPLPQPGEELTRNTPAVIVGRSRKRIGMAVADSPAGPWRRFDKPVLDTVPGTFYSYLTSNPAPLVEEDGSICLMFKSRRYEGNSYGKMFLGVARAASPEQPFQVVDSKPLSFGTDLELEGKLRRDVIICLPKTWQASSPASPEPESSPNRPMLFTGKIFNRIICGASGA